MSEPPTVDELLETARAFLQRVTPTEAVELCNARGAILVDIRPTELRDRDGTIPGAQIVDRNVLEWRLDPVGPNRIRQATSHDQIVIVVCDEGYASSLAALSLQQLGLRNATDLVGGFQAWKTAGLATDPPNEPH